MRVVVCCGGDRETPALLQKEEIGKFNSKVVLILFRRFGMQEASGLSHLLGEKQVPNNLGITTT